MPELDEARAAARQAADEAEAAQWRSAVAADRARRARQARDDLARRATRGRADDLDADVQELEQAAEEAREDAKRAAAAHLEAGREFGRLADPRRAVATMTDEVPVLLMPVRIETRFKDGELLVRVYPDEWAVDGFEARLSENEIDSARRFWAEVWRARGERDGALGAWRGLVRSHGSGRASWIVQQCAPTNSLGSVDPGDLVLVVAGPTLPAGADRSAVADFWTAMWRADGEAAAVQAARAALAGALDADRAAAVEEHPPFNFDDPPVAPRTYADTVVRVAFLELPTPDDLDAKAASWTEPPRASVLPERFVLLGYVGGQEVLSVIGNPVPPSLVVGPDPAAGPDDQLTIDDDGELQVPDDLRWMVDFDTAVDVGMGFRVRLDERTSGGFDRLFVLGLRLRSEPLEAKADLETLLRHHHLTRRGLALVPQGTPTNNSEQAAAGFDRGDDPEASFRHWFDGPSTPTTVDDWAAKADGQWLAEYLGIDPTALARVPNSDGGDQREARAANAALWPATWGYFLDTMMQPVIDDDTVEATRHFFVDYVRGRGAVPSIRIGRQPYGILPTTAFSRMTWAHQGPVITTHARGLGRMPFSSRLHALLQAVAADWAPLADGVPHVGNPGPDPHRTLLDVLALHPTSVEFHQRYAESVDDLFNRFNLGGFGGALVAALIALGYEQQGRDLLTRLGWDGDGEAPDILSKLFFGTQNALRGPLVDDRPLSESDPVRAYTDDDRNYLAWLADSARTSLEAVRRQEGFAGGKPPAALLYLLLRHALLLGYWETGLRLHVAAHALERPAVVAQRREPPFVHVLNGEMETESRWRHLYTVDAAVTGDDRLVVDFIPAVLGIDAAADGLAEQVQAIESLAEVPTARLERVLVEHLDTCTYRLDAWMLGLVHERLALMRLQRTEEGEERRQGIHLGAYGWLEDVRPAAKRHRPVEPAPEHFTAGPPLTREAGNGGYVHAPSLNHAATAAILRNGYLAAATSTEAGVMAVNLTSDRVRVALSVIDGIRKGQSLGALLGYRLERGLHDSNAIAEVDEYIYKLRKAFPLQADRIASTATPANVPIDAIEARNVIDGLRLVTHIHDTGERGYPFGRTDLPAIADPAKRDVIDDHVASLLDVHDAVADLALAEGVHQAVLGNFERVASTLDAYSKVGFPPEPEVTRTPRTGIALTHRVGLHFRPGLSESTSPVTGIAMTPRATAEPAVNDWLADLLPAPSNAVCQVRWVDPTTGNPGNRVVDQRDLGLQPIDLLYLVQPTDAAAMAGLDDRITAFVLGVENLRPDTPLELFYTEQVAGRVTFFELAPLLHSLRSLLLRSRPLRATDVALQQEATARADSRVSARRVRPAAVLASLEALAQDFLDFEAALAALPTDATGVAAQVDGLIDDLAGLLAKAALHGVAEAGWGSLLDWRRATFGALLDAVAEVVARWDEALATFAAILLEEQGLPGTATDDERFALLERAERLLTTTPTVPRPPALSALRTRLTTRHADFTARLALLRAVADTTRSTVGGLWGDISALLPLTAFEATGLDLAPLGERILAFLGVLRARSEAVRAQLATRIAAGTDHLSAHDATGDAQAKVDALSAATKAMLGDDAVFVPEFRLAAGHADEWANAVAAGRSGALTAHLADRPFPVDDWLHGVARVRDKMRHWEQVVLLGGAIGREEPELVPLQLPFEPGAFWAALEFPPGKAVTAERLLYTASYAVAFDKAAPQCGLLLDEWTEVVPGASETTGVVFNYDRPDSEPPQAMLLVTPPTFRGAWQWDDLVATLHETLDLARLRAVEPQHIDGTAYAQLLPATVMAATMRPISIATNLAINNNVAAYLGEIG